jgi:stage II sporulation protein D
MASLRLALFLLYLFAAPALAEPQRTVRVLLDEVEGTVLIEMAGAHRGYIDGHYRFSTPAGLSWPLTVQDGALYSEGARLGASFTLVPDEGFVSWGGRPYRGALTLVADEPYILVVNTLELEAYLRGVVPAEMPPTWPMEALKAQAVAARSYVVTHLKPDEPFDLCALETCQVYSGVEAEHARSDQAVAATRGLVLGYGNEVVRAYYHSDSGGVLASSAEVWGESLPYLVARADVSASTPHRQWERQLDPQAMAASLRSHGIDVGPVRALRILHYSESGRAVRAEVVGERARAVVEGPALRDLLRGWGLKSTRIVMASDLLVRGDGWGHGVGMSQYGARSMALAGHAFEEILAFYYPYTTLLRLAP